MRRISILFALTTVLDFAVNAQQSQNWKLQFELTPGISGVHYLNKDGSSETDQLITSLNEAGDPACTGQADVSIIKMFGRLGLKTGFIFSQASSKLQEEIQYGTSASDTLPSSVKTTVRLSGVSLPLLVYYEIPNGNWNWFAEAGGGLNWFFGATQHATLFYSDGHERTEVDHTNDGYTLDHPFPFVKISSGVNYRFNENWSAYISPTASYYFTRVEQDPQTFSTHFYFVGINVGVGLSL